MALAEQSVIDSINVLADGHIEVRRCDFILRDDVVVSRSYHRHVLAPGDDLANEDPRVRAHAATAWTEDVLAAWQGRRESNA